MQPLERPPIERPLIDRRRFLAGLGAAASALAGVSFRSALGKPPGGTDASLPTGAGWGAETTGPKGAVSPTNPLGVRAAIYTIVTPDLDASIHYYRDVMGFDLIGKGKLGARRPTVDGVGDAGRPYAFIRTMSPGDQHGILRLMTAPAGAKAIRPHPGSSIIDPGFAIIECMSRSVDESYHRLTAAGVKTITGPRYYFFNDMKALNGSVPDADFEIRSYSAFGPAGEQMFISSWVSGDHKPAPPWTKKGLHDGFLASALVSLDRWPVWDFYEAALGLKPTRDTYSGSEAVNELIGAPEGANCQFGMLGSGVDMEWWEYRDRPPTATAPFPTDLNKTGLAMTTMMVNDFPAVRARIQAAKLPIIGEGALPTPEKPYQDGLYLRGPLGELIEVIGLPT